MCKRYQEEHAEVMKVANKHMDDLGIPADSIERKLADIELAMNSNPILAMTMTRCWPSANCLLEQPVFQSGMYNG